jgi:hypothetical protein
MLFLAELYLPRDEQVADLARLARAGTASAAGDGMTVRFIQAVFVAADECCFVLYESDSVTAVAAAAALSGLEFDRVSAAEAAW